MTDNNEPYFLELEDRILTNGEARRLLIEVLSKNGINSPKGGWEKSTYNFGQGENIITVSFQRLLQDLKLNGVVQNIQAQIDANDEIFGGTFGISIPTMAMGPVTSNYAGYNRMLYPPMTDSPVEMQLSEDILFYREEACLYSNEYDFTFCTRYYRAYLTSCVAIIDAYINRHILIYKYQGRKVKEFEEVNKISRLEDRLNIFLQVDTGHELSSINKGIEWIHFKKLRQLRNEMTHINSPSLGYSIAEFAEHFNYVKKGIGGLLRLIRELQGRQSLGFIEKLRHAPIIYFNEITHKADGNHIIKRKK
jgi:hypothetical protein